MRDTNFEIVGRSFDIAVIIPASNEESYISNCLSAVLSQDSSAGEVQIIVAANACTDGTEGLVRDRLQDAHRRGWDLICQSSHKPGKIEAINGAETIVSAPLRVYLDADVVCDAGLFGQLRSALDCPTPRYATGTLVITPARTWVTRAYSAFWRGLPFVRSGAVGSGLFAVNTAGRSRWGKFPAIISDDTFVRINFTPDERVEVSACYRWPMVEGLRNLIRVRRRQDTGVKEIYRLYPTLRNNEGKPHLKLRELIQLALRHPVGFGVYVLVAFLVRVQSGATEWSRGR